MSEQASVKKNTPSLEDILNYEQNRKYLRLRRNKFWNLVEEKRRTYKISNPKDFKTKHYGSVYVALKHVPPFLHSELKIIVHISSIKTPFTSKIGKTSLFRK